MVRPLPPSDRPPSASDEEWARMQEKQLRESTKYMLGEKSLVTRPTRDLNDDRPGFRDEGRRGGGRRGGRRGGGKRDWWNEPKDNVRGIGSLGNVPPRVDYARPPRNDNDRWETLTGGNRLSSDSERMDLLTGKRSLPGDSERMRLLTGESDFGGRGSRYGGRREYDPQDRDFNRQFDTEPSGNRDVRSQFSSSNNALQNFGDTGSTKGWPVIDNVPTRRDQRENTLKDYDKGGDVERMYDEFRGKSTPSNQNWSGSSRSVSEFDPSVSSQWWEGDRKFKLIPEARGGIVDGKWDDNYLVSPPTITEFTPHPGDPDYDPRRQGSQAKYDDSNIKERIRNLESRPQSTGGNWQEDRIKALENRGPIVNQSTVDLSGVEGRISQLEGKKPQDLSGIQGRISELEGKAPSWQEDRISQLEGSRSESKSARNLLDQRIASLENYYKNDPPPAESTGNRYEDKMAELNRAWEVKNPTYDPDRLVSEDQPNSGWLDWTWGRRGEGEWAKSLPKPYEQQMRALNREYNKPTYEATIKGRDYKAYGALDKNRLKYLDDANIHEDEYLGIGSWENQYGENISGWGQGNKDRYFTSHSGLDKDSDEYKDRFKSPYGGTGKDYAWYQ